MREGDLDARFWSRRALAVAGVQCKAFGSPWQVNRPTDKSRSQYFDVSTLGWVVHFNVPDVIPLQGSIPYASVAKTCKVDQNQLARILRRCMLNNLFHEPSPGEVAHTPYSAALVTNSSVRNFVFWATDATYAASSKIAEASEKYPGSEDARETAFSVSQGGDISLFEWLHLPENEANAKTYPQLMKEWNSTPIYDMKHTVQGYDWASVQGTVVDIGGSTGEAGIAIARANPHLQVIVEDLPSVAAQGQTLLPPDLHPRVSFLPHDFFSPQPAAVRSANTYLIRWVLHDHGDQAAATILGHLVDCMRGRPDARIVVVDGIMPAPGSVPYAIERQARDMDMIMMQIFNAKERAVEDWRELFGRVDDGLEIVRVNQPEGSGLATMEVALRE